MLISTALTLASLGAKVGSGISNIVRTNNEIKSLKKDMASLDDWYKAESNEDYLNTDQAKDMLKRLRDMMKKNQDINKNTAAVMGGTAEGEIAANESNNAALAQAMSGMAAQDTVRKDSLRQDYTSQKNTLSQRLAELRKSQIQSSVNAGANALDALGSVTSAGKMGAFNKEDGSEMTLADFFGFSKAPKVKAPIQDLPPLDGY